MPRLSSFYGITVWMYYDDHDPPHLHARYAGRWAQVAVGDGALLAGDLPGRAQRLLREWIELHAAELAANWDRARRDEPLHTIAPLP